jgi:uncharacterized repeat protein (TIGR01451 family)
MNKQYSIMGLGSLALLTLAAGSASADPKLRLQVDQRGDFALIGTTLAQECSRTTPPPVAGTLGDCGASTNESGPDVFWRSDSPADGKAEANLDIAPEAARTTAVLALPEGAIVTHAYLYWAARNTAGADQTVELHHESGFESAVTAIDSVEVTITRDSDLSHNYQSVADVTSIVKASGPGAYRIGGVDAVDVRNRNDDVVFAAWWMVIFYEEPGAPPRNLALFDGLDRVSAQHAQQGKLSGFKVPDAGFDAKLGIIAFEGDNNNTGDSIFFNPTDPALPDATEALHDALNPANNFFNGTRSTLGVAVSPEGDVPRLAGTPQSMSGVDIDVVDVSAKLKAGDQEATIVANSALDLFFLAGWVTSISTYGPDFSGSNKVATDLNGTPTFRGDVVEYSITTTNSGNDDSIDTVVVDTLPAGVTLVPGSLQIVEGNTTSAQTDAAGDDLAEYDANTRTVIFRLGSGADSARGGSVGARKSVVARFQVTVDEDAVGVISNQATISAAGKLGAPQREDVTDGNGAGAGAPPTDITVQPDEIIAVQPDSFYGAGSGLFGPCSAGGVGGGAGSAAWLAGAALAGALRRRRRQGP